MANPRRRVDWLYTLLGGAIVVGMTWGVGRISTGIDHLRVDVAALRKDVSKDVTDLRVEVAELRTSVGHGMADRFTGKEGEELGRRIEAVEKEFHQLREKVEYHVSKGAYEIHRELHQRRGEPSR